LKEFLNFVSGFLKNFDYLIFVLEKDLLYSFSFKSTFLRGSEQISLQEQELENILQKTQQKIFNLWQKEVKSFLKTRQIDLKICDSSCKKVFINNHLVANPLGFKGNSISFLLENTLIDKNLFYSLKIIFKKLFEKNPSLSIKFVEKNFCFLKSIEDLVKENFLYLGTWKEEIELSILGEEIFEKNLLKLNWSFFKSGIEKISETLKVNKEIGEKIYFLYFNKKVSLKFHKKLNQILETTFLGLRDGLKFLFSQIKLKNKNFKKVLILGDDLFWEKTRKINLNECFKGQVKKIVLNPEDCLSKLKIKVKLNKKRIEKEDFLKILDFNYPFLEKNETVSNFISKIIFRI
ncbi:hypothetical protein J7J41_00455, partial [bacterium]|nr:hypothetical protein [bacterium]